MGMFDTISVSGDLPFSQEMISLGVNKNNLSFQTKDLDCAMSLYIIQDDQLFVEKYKTSKWIEGNKKGKSFLDRMGHLKTEDPYFDKVHFHGEIYFYDSINDVQGKWDCWVEFKAVFSDSKLQKIELFEFTKTDNAERKIREKEFREQIKQERGKWVNKYFFYTKFYTFFYHKIWRNFWVAVANVANKLAY